MLIVHGKMHHWMNLSYFSVADSIATQQPVSRLCLLKLELGWKRRPQFVTFHSHVPYNLSYGAVTAASAIFNVLFDLQAGGARQKKKKRSEDVRGLFAVQCCSLPAISDTGKNRRKEVRRS